VREEVEDSVGICLDLCEQCVCGQEIKSVGRDGMAMG
jgi:hypothetical protein